MHPLPGRIKEFVGRAAVNYLLCLCDNFGREFLFLRFHLAFFCFGLHQFELYPSFGELTLIFGQHPYSLINILLG
ncbi:MAG: hypothetical protein A4E45_00813 [Methanosaeta sp. PtaB.Bin039]|nr:MAG: hypothetical protein A4E45_00813 [Methanosaeta sp. PtaB.Bin039]